MARIERGLVRALEPARAVPQVVDVRVLGAIGVVETREPLPLPAVQEVCLAHGVWLRPFGRLIYTMPPYVASDDEVARVGAAIVDTVTSVPSSA